MRQYKACCVFGFVQIYERERERERQRDRQTEAETKTERECLYACL